MGTDVHVLLDGPVELLPEAAHTVQHLDRLWSRFKEDSEVSQLNRAAGDSVAVSAETVRLIERSIEAWGLSQGNFNPTLLNEVVAAGYDRDYSEVSDEGGGPALPKPNRPDEGPGVTVSAGEAAVTPGVSFDSGGLGKGLGADIVVEKLLENGAKGVLVNLGGDLRTGGTAPDEGWPVKLDNPFDPEGTPMAAVTLKKGALATSTPSARTWAQDGKLRHHIIDPATGEPAETKIASVTVVADEGWKAEALTKAVLLAEPQQGLEMLEGQAATGLVVTKAGQIALAKGMEQHLERIVEIGPPQVERMARFKLPEELIQR